MAWGENDAIVQWGAKDKVVAPVRSAADTAAQAKVATRKGSGRAAMGGLSLGFDDEMTAAGAAVDTFATNALRRVVGSEPLPYNASQAFDATLSAERAAQKTYATEHPIANAASSMYGGLPWGMIPGTAPAKGVGLLPAMAKTAAVGGAIGTAAGAGNAEGGLIERAAGAGRGGAAGAVLGAVIPAASKAVGGLIPRRVQVDESAALNEASQALNEAGIEQTPNTMRNVLDLVRQGKSAREAALAVASTTDLPVPVPTTRGQRTGAPGQQLSENLMLRGARGAPAARQMRGIVSEQQDALRGNTTAITEQIAGGPVVERGAGGAAVSERLNSLRDTANKGVNAAYDAARSGEGVSWVPREQGAVLGQAVRSAVTDFDMRDLPSVANKLDDLDKLAGSGQVTVRDLFDVRSRLSSLRANGGAEAGAAGKAVRALDGQIDELVANDLISGDPSSVQRWKDAIGARREFGKLFEGDDLIQRLTERGSRGGQRDVQLIDVGDAANYILGRNDLGFVGQKNLNRDITRLRDVLGTDSQEWNALRAEAFQRLASKAEGGVEFGQRNFSGVKFQKAWDDLSRKDPRLVATLFTSEERALISRFGTIAARVTSPVKGGDNNSNTAVAGMRLLGKLQFLRNVPFAKDAIDGIEEQVNLGTANRATSQTVSKAKPAPRGMIPQPGGGLAGATAGGYAGGD